MDMVAAPRHAAAKRRRIMTETRPPAQERQIVTDKEALLFHSRGRPGKLAVIATKPMATQRDLSLA